MGDDQTLTKAELLLTIASIEPGISLVQGCRHGLVDLFSKTRFLGLNEIETRIKFEIMKS